MHERNKRLDRSIRSPYSARSFSLPRGAGGSTILIWRYLFPETRTENKGSVSVCRRLSSANPRQTIFVSHTSVYDSLTPTMVRRPLTFLEYLSIVLFEGHSLSLFLSLSPSLFSSKTNFSGSKLETADATEHLLYLSTLTKRAIF